MEKRYLVLVNNTVAKTRKTLAFALRDKKELETKGYTCISIAERLLPKEI